MSNDRFGIKTPIFSVSPAITAKIGMKGDVTARKRYKVLEQYQDEQERTHYRRVGVVQSVSGRIWAISIGIWKKRRQVPLWRRLRSGR